MKIESRATKKEATPKNVGACHVHHGLFRRGFRCARTNIESRVLNATTKYAPEAVRFSLLHLFSYARTNSSPLKYSRTARRNAFTARRFDEDIGATNVFQRAARMRCAALLTVWAGLASQAGQAADAQPGPASAPSNPPVVAPIKEEELRRVVRVASDVFPWVKAQQNNPAAAPVAPPKPTPPVGGDSGALPDMTSGDVVIREYGDFSTAPGATPDKQIMILTKDVICETLTPRSVLRAQKFKITRDLKTGTTDLIEAFTSVEMYMPEQKGKGETLHYDTRFGPHGEVVKDLFILEGNRASGKRAYLWLGTDPDPEKNDKVEADRFVNDRRLNTFRALGSPAAITTMSSSNTASAVQPAQPAQPAKSFPSSPSSPLNGAKPAPASGGMMPNMSSLSSGGTARLQCDGEMFFDGSNGRLTLNTNALIQQEGQIAPDGTRGAGVKLAADTAHMIMDVPPPGMPTVDASGQPAPSSGMLSGNLRTIECIGRVEIKTGTHVILCDRATIDVLHNILYTEMKNPREEVRIFAKDNPPGSGNGSAMTSRKSFTFNTDTQDIQSPYGIKSDALPDAIPTNRPAVKQTAPAAPASPAPPAPSTPKPSSR